MFAQAPLARTSYTSTTCHRCLRTTRRRLRRRERRKRGDVLFFRNIYCSINRPVLSCSYARQAALAEKRALAQSSSARAAPVPTNAVTTSDGSGDIIDAMEDDVREASLDPVEEPSNAALHYDCTRCVRSGPCSVGDCTLFALTTSNFCQH